MGSGGVPLGRYRLRTTMTPLAGQPVNWNARAHTWSGNDWRYWLRVAVAKVVARIPHTRAASRSYRLRMWVWRCIDNRPSERYTVGQRRIRRLLNTQADVDARQSWAETNKYWKQRERDRAARGES